MFASIHLSGFGSSFPQITVSENDNIQKFKKKNVGRIVEIAKYIICNNKIDADALADDFFREIDADVFISHAHADENDVVRLALRLQEMGLKPFVDSCVWGHMDDVIRCFNLSTQAGIQKLQSNMDTIVCSALHRMIDASELFLFLETGNSASRDAAIRKGASYLSSPWIYSELSFSTMVRRKARKRSSNLLEAKSIAAMEKANEVAEFIYPVPELDAKIASSDFMTWVQASRYQNYTDEPVKHLDDLYVKACIPLGSARSR